MPRTVGPSRDSGPDHPSNCKGPGSLCKCYEFLQQLKKKHSLTLPKPIMLRWIVMCTITGGKICFYPRCGNGKQNLLSYWWIIVPNTIRKPRIPLVRSMSCSTLPMWHRSTNLSTKKLFPFLKLFTSDSFLPRSRKLMKSFGKLHFVPKGDERKGLQLDCVLDTCRLNKTVWDSISRAIIIGCWKH